MRFNDVIIEDTSDVCRLTIPYVQMHHFGELEVRSTAISLIFQEPSPFCARTKSVVLLLKLNYYLFTTNYFYGEPCIKL